jgi:hypothetical protein
MTFKGISVVGQDQHVMDPRAGDTLCVPKTLNPTIMVMKSAKKSA